MDATAYLSNAVAAEDRLEPSRSELKGSFEPKLVQPPPRVLLAQLAREAAVASTPELTGRPFTHRDDGPHCRTELLAVLIFSYGTGLYTLERICDAIQKDVLFRSLIGPNAPYPDSIRAFRRQERTALKAGLKRFFELASARRQEHLDCSTYPAECSWLKALRMHHPLPNRPETLEKLVVDRVNQATWTDRMMMLDY